MAQRPSDGRDAPNYDRLSSIYDALGWLYSAGGIERSKLTHIDFLEPGDSVLYAGAGTGAECRKAAERKAEVTVCDSSAQMVARARERFEAHHLRGTFLVADALTVAGDYDVVVAPYFLNVFDGARVGPALAALAAKVKPGGKLMSIDFRAPAGSFALRLLQRLYYLPPQVLFLFLSQNPWHELYDYTSIAKDVAPELKVSERLVSRAFGLPLLETIVWSKVA